MRFIVNIAHVDEESYCGVSCPTAMEALAFLDKHDHEGSSIRLDVEEVEDPKEVYRILRLLEGVNQ